MIGKHKYFWAALGLLTTGLAAFAQSTDWRAVNGNDRIVRLTPPANDTETGAIRKTSYVVRGTMLGEEIGATPKVLPILPMRGLEPVTADRGPDRGQILHLEKDGRIVGPNGVTQRVSTPALDPKEKIIILNDERSSTWFNFGDTGSRRLYVQAEFLLWATSGFHVPPLATTASAADNPDTRAALGFQTTQLLFGDSRLLDGVRPGARLTVGFDIDPCGCCTIEASAFFLARHTDSAFFSSDALPVIGRPFFNINTGMQDRELTTTPEFTNGNLQIHASSTLWGAEINRKCLLWCGCDYDIYGFLGFRYLDLHEQLSIEENTFFIKDVPAPAGGPPLFNAGDRTFVFDRFETHNRFYGGQIGISGQRRYGPWSVDTTFKFAMGAVHQTVDIDGGQRFDRVNGTVQTFQGGLLALPTNIGHFSQTRFAVVPELGIKLGYQLTDNVRIFVGYDFLYWSSVLRPGDQIDTALDANKIPNFGGNFPAATQVRPIVPFRTTGYFATGLNAGIEFRY